MTTTKPLSPIAQLNDAFRSGRGRVPGRIIQTVGISALPADVQTFIVRRVQAFDAWTPDNDPHGEHDFGTVIVVGDFETASYHANDRDADLRVFWKIDYFENDECEYGAEHPDDPTQSFRILTIMRAEEY